VLILLDVIFVEIDSLLVEVVKFLSLVPNG